MLEAAVSGCDAEIWLNDVPLILLGKNKPKSVAIPVNELVVDGPNVLVALVQPGPTPASARANPSKAVLAGASVRASLSEYKAGAVPGDGSGTTLIALEWVGTDREEVFPNVVVKEKDLGPRFGPWAWQAASPMSLSAGDASEIAAMLNALRSSLSQRSPDLLLQLAAIRTDEIERAYGLPRGSRAQLGRDILTEVFAKPTFAMAPLKPEQFDFRGCAGGRLVECIAKDWQPILRQQPVSDEAPIDLPMLVGRVGGKLAILR